VIADMSARHNVDRARVFLFGHSNGGFMAYRYACERAGAVAAIVTLAGATWRDDERCAPAEPVSVLHLHGTWDPIVLYGGGRFLLGRDGYPGARDTIAMWARYDGCTSAAERRGELDLDAFIPGAETEIWRHGGCAGGSDVELWRIDHAGHVPIFRDGAMTAIYRWLAARPKPR
jgi:polyhydroxybutyrate depolymerase